MEQIIVKTEMEGGEILLFYVDDADGNTVETAIPIENIQNVTDIQNITDLQNITQVHPLPDNTTYIMEEAEDSTDEAETTQSANQAVKEKWLPDETSRLLMFYIDNKEIFQSGATKMKHLWSVACKTMLSDKSPLSCEKKIRAMKRKYAHVRVERQKGINLKFPHIDLCHKAFHDDNFVNMMLKENLNQPINTVKMPITPQSNKDGIVVVKSLPATHRSADNKVENMLKLYIQYKKEFQKEYWRKDLWDRIAMDIGEEDADYWHKRFLNFKQHYLRMLNKRTESGPDSVNWPYMALFDQIFHDDKEFQRKIVSKLDKPVAMNIVTNSAQPFSADNWNTTEMTVLIKYIFDCFDEFQDTTIPNKFLWHEVGRLLDKTPDLCKHKFEELKDGHLDKYIECEYELRNRVPIAILLDNVIAKETEIELGRERKKQAEHWETQDVDDLVKHFYENIEMFKDPICYFVCWASVVKKLNRSIYICVAQWDELTNLYKSILNEKKEDSDLQIDWRYIELFDRIFDYGTDTNLLDTLAKIKARNAIVIDTDKIRVKKVDINFDTDNMEKVTDDEEYDEKGFMKRTKRGIGDSKAFKILEFFQKNKDKFSTTQRKKQALWEILAKQIGISAEQCAHRLRNLKQVYTGYVQREIDKPEMLILWPYYALCKKVFGYRAIKSKLKNNKTSEDEEWSAKEIKQIINYFKQNFAQMSEYSDSDISKWSACAKDIGRSERSCMDKFVELRKSYRKLKTMKANNADVKVSWKYFNMFDEIYNMKIEGDRELESMEVDEIEQGMDQDGDRIDSQEEDDYQCIIVMPEGQDISDIEQAQIIMQQKEENLAETPESSPRKWTKITKKRLLMYYLNYIRARKGKDIEPTEMWKEIASKLPEKSALSCRKVFAKLKSMQSGKDDASNKKSPYYKLIEKILALKPKFVKSGQKTLQEVKAYKDVPLPTVKVEHALQYYLLHLEEFVNPKFEKKHLWTELANFVSEPVTKVFNKVNYLKQFYDIETDEVSGEKTLFSELLKEIVTKEVALKAITDDPKPIEDQGVEQTWSDDETEQLLIWYLANLEQFKDPKYSRKYLWLESANILNKTPLACSKKMTEIRTQYRNMVKENSEDLSDWKFYGLCQKIYGTGKKNETETNDVK